MKSNSFEEQVVVISGAAEGIGKAIAKRLAAEGVKLALFDRNKDVLQKTVNELKETGCTVKGWTLDVSKEPEVILSFEEVAREFGKIDIMINSAGIIGPTGTSVLDYDVKDFDMVYIVNLRGTFLMSKYALKHMVKNNYGRLLLIASMAGKEGNPLMSGYSASKAGVIGLVKALGKEFATTGITVNGLAPTVINTTMADSIERDHLQYMTSKIPMGRLGTTEEVAAMAAFIVSRENSFSTGFIYDISGGRATY